MLKKPKKQIDVKLQIECVKDEQRKPEELVTNFLRAQADRK
jgi:hypothetical protein